MNKVRNALLLSTIIAFFVCMNFVWVTLYKIGSFNLRFYHIPLLMSLILLFFPSFFKSIVHVVKSYKLLIGTYTTLFLLYCLSLVWSVQVNQGIGFLLKEFMYFSFFFLFSGVLYTSLSYKILKLPSDLFIYCFVGFTSIILLIFYSQGLSLGGELMSAIISQNSQYITYKFLPLLFKFNFFTSEIVEDWTNSRNILALSLSLSFVCNLAFKKKGVLMYSVIIINALCILITLSRSGQLYLLMTGLYIFLFVISKSKRWLILLLIPVSIVYLSTKSVSNNVLLERYVAVEEESRLKMYHKTIVDIFKSPLIGYGIGATITYEIGNGITKSPFVHNFILGSWFVGGIIGLLLSMTYCYLFLRMIYYNHLFFKRAYKNRKQERMISVISVLPLFVFLRMMIGGNYGNSSMIGWAALSIYLVTVLYCKEQYFIEKTEHDAKA